MIDWVYEAIFNHVRSQGSKRGWLEWALVEPTEFEFIFGDRPMV